MTDSLLIANSIYQSLPLSAEIPSARADELRVPHRGAERVQPPCNGDAEYESGRPQFWDDLQYLGEWPAAGAVGGEV